MPAQLSYFWQEDDGTKNRKNGAPYKIVGMIPTIRQRRAQAGAVDHRNADVRAGTIYKVAPIKLSRGMCEWFDKAGPLGPPDTVCHHPFVCEIADGLSDSTLKKVLRFKSVKNGTTTYTGQRV